jgi:hypothetical protein
MRIAKQSRLAKQRVQSGKSRTKAVFDTAGPATDGEQEYIYILRHGRLPRFSWIYYGKQKSEIGKK